VIDRSLNLSLGTLIEDWICWTEKNSHFRNLIEEMSKNRTKGPCSLTEIDDVGPTVIKNDGFFYA
jgi:hypothetical protein